MTKLLILFSFLFLNVVSVFAGGGDEEMSYAVMFKNGSYWCELERPVVEHANKDVFKIGLDASIKSGGQHCANVFFRVSTVNESPALASVCEALYRGYGEKGKTDTRLYVKLSNGEVFRTSDAVVYDSRGLVERNSKTAGSIGIGFSLESLSGNFTAWSNGAANHRNNVEKLAVYDITELKFDGYSIRLRDFRTAALLRAMFGTLRRNTEAYDLFPYFYGEYPALKTVSKTLDAGRFTLSGTVYNVPDPSGSVFGYLRKSISQWEQCRTGAIQIGHGGVAVYGRNGYANATGTSSRFVDNIKKLNEINAYVSDVHITGDGDYAVLFGGNGFYYSGAPDDFVSQVSEFNKQGVAVLSASFNDLGDWAIAADGYFVGYPQRVMDFMTKATDLYGHIYSVTMTNCGLLVCCENGVCFENVPANLIDRLSNLNFRPRVVKFTDSGLYLVTDGISRCIYLL